MHCELVYPSGSCSKTCKDKTIIKGSRGGIYYINDNGIKTYCKQSIRNTCKNIWNTQKKSLGDGAYGDVFITCKNKSNDCNYAIKVQNLDTKEKRDIFNNEVRILKKLQFTNVVPKLYDAWICKNTGYVVMEVLFKEKKRNSKVLSEKVFEVVKRIHEENIVLIDFNNGNFMYDKQGNIRIIDFGLAVDYTKIKGKYSHPYAEDYGDFTFEEGKYFDKVQVYFSLSTKKEKEKMMKVLMDWENNKNIKIPTTTDTTK